MKLSNKKYFEFFSCIFLTNILMLLSRNEIPASIEAINVALTSSGGTSRAKFDAVASGAA